VHSYKDGPRMERGMNCSHCVWEWPVGWARSSKVCPFVWRMRLEGVGGLVGDHTCQRGKRVRGEEGKREKLCFEAVALPAFERKARIKLRRLLTASASALGHNLIPQKKQ